MVEEHREAVERRLEALQRVVEQQASALRCWCCGFVPGFVTGLFPSRDQHPVNRLRSLSLRMRFVAL